MATAAPSKPASNRDVIFAAARQNEPDRYIAALFAPKDAREDLVTLAAYLGEIRRIPLAVSDAMLGEIRLQWWRDTLAAGAQGGLSGNPIADEMVRVIARHDLPLALILKPLDAASLELDGEPFSDDAQSTSYLDCAEGAATELSARIMGLDQAPASTAALENGARAYGIIRLVLRLPELVSKGRWPVPQAVAASGDPRQLDEARARAIIRQASEGLCREANEASVRLAGVNPAILPAALIASYAKAIRRPQRDALREPAQIAPLTRMARLWWASRLGRF